MSTTYRTAKGEAVEPGPVVYPLYYETTITLTVRTRFGSPVRAVAEALRGRFDVRGVEAGQCVCVTREGA